MANYRLPSRFLGSSNDKVAEFHFRSNDSGLDAVDFGLADRIGAHVKRRADGGEKISLYFVGNCDHTGKAHYNKRLALRRAKAVRKAVIDAAGGWSRVLNSSLLESNFIVARSFGEERANQRARTREALAADRRVDVWHEIPRVFKISIPESLIRRRRELSAAVAEADSKAYDAQQHAVLAGSTRYEGNEFTERMKRADYATRGTQSIHPIERRVEARIKLKVIKELEKVADERIRKWKRLQKKLSDIDKEIDSYNEIR